jgi:hypothetical protein
MANFCGMQKNYYYDLLCHKQKDFLESFYWADLKRSRSFPSTRRLPRAERANDYERRRLHQCAHSVFDSGSFENGVGNGAQRMLLPVAALFRESRNSARNRIPNRLDFFDRLVKSTLPRTGNGCARSLPRNSKTSSHRARSGVRHVRFRQVGGVGPHTLPQKANAASLLGSRETPRYGSNRPRTKVSKNRNRGNHVDVTGNQCFPAYRLAYRSVSLVYPCTVLLYNRSAKARGIR